VIYRRQGRWDDALATLEMVTVLDPLNPSHLLEYAWTLQGARRYGAATPVFERISHVDDEPITPTAIAHNGFLQSGNLAGVDAALAGLPANYDPGCQVSWFRYFSALYQRRYADAAAAASACKEASFPADGSEVLPPEYPALRAQWFAGNRRNLPQAGPLRQRFERTLAAKPDQPYTRIFLAFTLVMLGEQARALEEADRALAAMPLSRDAVSGAFILLWVAEVQANAGAPDRALGTLAQALSVPYGGGVEEIRLDPVFDPLRQDPRFQRLLDERRAKGA
jgi:tetratricopeptide (TPR) repeat protein